MALVTLHQDNFNRSDRALNGDTMSDGIGAWADDYGAWNIASNQAHAPTTALDGSAVVYDSVMSAVDIQRVSVVRTSSNALGVIGRYDPATNHGYMAYWSTIPNCILYRTTAGSVYTSLGTGTASSAGDTIALDASGSSITFLVNGTAKVGPVTDANYATGVAAMYGTGTGRYVDTFLVQVDQASSAIFNYIGKGMKFIGRMLGGGL